MKKTVRLRRSVLSAPANRERMIAKALGLPADMVMLDLEDSVPVSEKEEARKRVISVLREGEWGARVRAVRVNGMDTPFAYRDIIEVVEAAGDKLDVIVIPKVNDPAEVKAVAYLLTQIEMHKGFRRPIGLEASIETAGGMLEVGKIAFSSERLEALVFGVADYGASLGMKNKGVSGHGEAEDFYPGHRYHYPLSRMAMAAKAAGLAAIDAPYGDFKDPEGLKESCGLGSALGYNGKWAIHPDQIDIINCFYTPSPEEVGRAQRILSAYKESLAAGCGSFAVDGKMVDAASVRLAEALCVQWEAIAGAGEG